MKASAEQVLFLYSTRRPDLIVPEDAAQLKDGASAKYRGNICLRANQSRFTQRCGGINASAVVAVVGSLSLPPLQKIINRVAMV